MGFLDSLANPTVSQGLLGMAAGLLNPANTYGRFGASLGNGLLGFQQGEAQAQNMALKKRQIDTLDQYKLLQGQQLQMAMDQQKFRNQMGAWLMGGSVPTSQPATPMAAGGMPATGAQAFPVAAAGAPPNSQGPIPTAQPAQAQPMIPAGLQKAALADLVFNGGKGIAALMKPDIQNVRPGGTVYDATGGRILFSAPTTSGAQVVYGPNGPSMSLLPGAAQAEATVSTAKARGPATFRTQTVNDASGSNVLTTDAAVADQIARATQTNGLPMPYVNAVLQTESGGRPDAVSPAGATGPMQTMPGTLANPGFGVTPAQDNSPGEKARVGVDYLGAMMKKYQNPTLTAIAYNMGPQATDQWLSSGGDYSKLPQETKDYVSRVMTRTAVGEATQKSQSVPGIQVQNEGMTAANTQLGKDQAQTLIDSRKAAISATDDITNIGQERQALAGGTFGGSGAQAKLNAVKFLQGWVPGLSGLDASKVTNTDYLVSTLGRGLLTHAKDLGYNPTDTDATRIEAIIGTIGKDPQALSNLLDYQEMMANRAITRHNTLVQQAGKNGLNSAFDMSVSPHTGMPSATDAGPASNGGFKIVGVR